MPGAWFRMQELSEFDIDFAPGKAMTRVTIKIWQKPTKQQMDALREAAKYPIVYDQKCPPSDEKALAEFAEQNCAIRVMV